ncbi:MAG: phosphoribosyltransferase family protein [Pseudomonadota bacterium]
MGSFCGLCQQSVQGLASHRGLCEHCFADLPWRENPEANDLDPALIEKTVVPWHYRESAQHWILAAKQAQGLLAARLLGTLLAETLVDVYGPGELPELIIPVPLSWRRLLARGHNQAQWIAAPVSRSLGLPLIARGVRRRRHTALQPGLSATARRENLAGAFATKIRFQGQRVAIVDDVLTTGATVETLAACLLEAGADSVHCWAAAAADHER